MLSLLTVDVCFVAACIYLWRGPSVLILFGFEYTILAVSVLSTFIRYVLHLIDMNIEGNWPQKGSYIFFLEFITEVVRFLSYVVFFTIIFTYYGMPLHIVRDLWMSYVNLKRRLIIFNKYRKLTANMNERFPDATEEELAACEHTCIICRDAMDVGKKLPCGHIFHLDCLRLWLQQQQSCPTCRAEIPTDTVPAGAVPRAAPALAAAGGGGGGIRAPGQEAVAQPAPGVQPPALPHMPFQPQQQALPAQQAQHMQGAAAGGAAPRGIPPASPLRQFYGGGGAPLPPGGVPHTFPHPPAYAGNAGAGMPPHPSFPYPANAGMPAPHLPPFQPPGGPFFNLPPWAPVPFPRGLPGFPPTASIEPVDRPEGVIRYYLVVNSSGAEVRSGPEDSSPVIRTLAEVSAVSGISNVTTAD